MNVIISDGNQKRVDGYQNVFSFWAVIDLSPISGSIQTRWVIDEGCFRLLSDCTHPKVTPGLLSFHAAIIKACQDFCLAIH